jgi:iron complex outermembrane receptor protein
MVESWRAGLMAIRCKPLLHVVMTILATAPVSAIAATPELEEVTVTARRVEERQWDVPISVDVLDGRWLDETAIAGWDGLALPAIKNGPAGVMDVISLRGMASGIDFGIEQSVPTYDDGVWFGSSRASRIPFVDGERIEVLKGPQPTYFGKNAVAGAFSKVSRKPQPDFSAEVAVYREFEHDETTLTGILNLPLNDRAAVRVAGRARDMGGYMQNSVDGSRTPRQIDRLGRVSLRFKPGDVLTLDAKVEYAFDRTSGRETQYVRCEPQTFTNTRLLNPAVEDCNFDLQRSFRFDPAAFGEALNLFTDVERPGERQDLELLSTRVAGGWQFPSGYSLQAIVAYYDQDFFAWVKPDQSWNQRMLVGFDDSTRVDSQELRLASPQGGRLEWMVGAYREDVARDNAPLAQVALQAGGASVTNWWEDSAAWSVFGEMGLRLSDTMTLRPGARYTRGRRGIVANKTYYRLAPGGAGTDQWSFAVPQTLTQVKYVATAQARRDDKFTPEVALEWRLRESQLLYLNWREGYKAGGFSSFLDGGTDKLRFEPEAVQYWEGGIKERGADGSWQVSAAVFNGEFRNLQLYVVNSEGNGATRNAGSAHSRGFELELARVLGAHWQVAVTFSLLDAAYDDLRDAQCYASPVQTIAQGCVRTGGNPLPPDATVCQGIAGVICTQDLSGFPTSFAPHWSGMVSLKHRRSLDIAAFGGLLELRAALDCMATSSYYTSVNGAPGSKQGGFAKLDARLAIASSDDHWEVALIGRNLTDRLYANWYEPMVGGGFNSGWFATTARPRQIGIQVRRTF